MKPHKDRQRQTAIREEKNTNNIQPKTIRYDVMKINAIPKMTIDSQNDRRSE